MRVELCGVLVLALVHPLEAQTPWSLTLETSRADFSAAAHDTSTPPMALSPGWPTMVTLRLQHSGERHGLALGVTYAHAPLAVWAEDLKVVLERSNEVVEIAPEWRYILIDAPSGARLITSLGPIFDGWGPTAEPIRWRVGGMAGVTLEFPLSAGWQVGIRGDFAMTGSYLRPQDDDDQVDIEPTMRRTRIGLGITKRL